jgi:N utilization substance protein B
VPVKVIINEYLNVAHAFFEGEEPGVVNGVLDRVARKVRTRELNGQAAN